MLSNDGEIILFRFSFMRVSTGSALSRREGERGYCLQGEETPDWRLLKLPPLWKEEGTPGHRLQGRAALLLSRGPNSLPTPMLLGWQEAQPLLSTFWAELRDS